MEADRSFICAHFLSLLLLKDSLGLKAILIPRSRVAWMSPLQQVLLEESLANPGASYF